MKTNLLSIYFMLKDELYYAKHKLTNYPVSSLEDRMEWIEFRLQAFGLIRGVNLD